MASPRGVMLDNMAATKWPRKVARVFARAEMKRFYMKVGVAPTLTQEALKSLPASASIQGLEGGLTLSGGRLRSPSRLPSWPAGRLLRGWPMVG